MPGVADTVRQFGPAYGAAMPASHRRPVRDLATCRTPALGGCEHYVYHSCRNWSCAQYHGVATADWLATGEAELLPVSWFHVVFTLPAALRDLARAHQRVCLAGLLTTAAESPQALAAHEGIAEEGAEFVLRERARSAEAIA